MRGHVGSRWSADPQAVREGRLVPSSWLHLELQSRHKQHVLTHHSLPSEFKYRRNAAVRMDEVCRRRGGGGVGIFAQIGGQLSGDNLRSACKAQTSAEARQLFL